MKIQLTIVFLVLGILNVFSQAPGLVVQTGLTAAYSKDGNVTKANQGHYGWMVGADARILDGDLYFIVGGQYHQTSLASTASPSFFSKNDFKF
ncbi:MAG: hypothetical protein IPP49_01465 [Saprospiraceae bacterium]|nr:hypothetical protein [Saprospiraceae bacterium]